MKITLIGATGFVGSAILKEALSRGHQIKAIVRNISKLPQQPNLTGESADVYDENAVARAVAGQDAVISAFNPGWADAEIYQHTIDGTHAILNGVKKAGVKRLLVVGGAGSLEIKPGLQLVDTPNFPAQFKQGALGAREALNIMRQETGLDWSFISPAAFLKPGERTGKFRLGGDQLVTDAKGESHISVEDMAVAILDEIEKPQHIRGRFTLAY
jgi:putative NADH-flavin reductase